MQVEHNPSELLARDLMSPEVLTVTQDLSLERLARFFIDNSISGAPVTDDEGKPIGVVSVTDLVRRQSQSAESLFDKGQAAYFHPVEVGQLAYEEFPGLAVEADSGAIVADIMTPIMFTVEEDTPIHLVADTMMRGRIHRLVVTRNKRVVGILTAFDLLRVVRDCTAASS